MTVDRVDRGDGERLVLVLLAYSALVNRSGENVAAVGHRFLPYAGGRTARLEKLRSPDIIIGKEAELETERGEWERRGERREREWE